jgi:hypothetical protein
LRVTGWSNPTVSTAASALALVTVIAVVGWGRVAPRARRRVLFERFVSAVFMIQTPRVKKRSGVRRQRSAKDLDRRLVFRTPDL